MELEKYWAKTKPFQSVITHGLVSGKVAQVLFCKYLSSGTRKLLEREIRLDTNALKAFLGYLVSIHDIGKIEYSFQSKDPQVRKILECDSENRNLILSPNVRHEKTGERCTREILNQVFENRRLSGMLSKIIGAHHPGKNGKDGFYKDSTWFYRQKKFEEQMRQYFLGTDVPIIPDIQKATKGTLGALLLSVVILADWISSGKTFEDAETWINEPDSEETIVSKSEDFLDRSGLAPNIIKWPEGFCDFWPMIPVDGRRPLQIEVERLFESGKQPYSLILLEAPMGEGKTEAGVFAAIQMARQWGKDGFYIALPTAATANQMVSRIRFLLEQHSPGCSVKLLHAMSWLEHTEELYGNSNDENDEIANWLAPTRRGLLAQFAVGTVDQAMLAATTVKYGFFRLLGLSNKVLVIDEIHSYDAYMSEIIKRLLEWCKMLEIPVVMLSATLPPEKKRELFSPYTDKALSQDYPLITAISADGTVRERIVNRTTHKMEATRSLMPILNEPDLIASTAIKMVTEGGCLCILMNTVKEAQKVYSAVKQLWDGDMLLFHAQFPAEQRAKIEQECIRRYGKDKRNRPLRSILVATQVVEQSLDVDFDTMITAVAPIDLLLQRLGRVHRHEETPRPSHLGTASIGVLLPADGESFGSSAYIYPECLLKSGIRVLQKKQVIQIPEDVAWMVRDGYDPSQVPQEDLEEWMENLIKEQVEAGASQQFLANSPTQQYNALLEDSIFEDDGAKASVTTRLGEPTIRIALLESELFKELTPYLKNIKGVLIAEVWRKSIAEMVMRQSLTISSSYFQREMDGFWDLQGGKLLSGTHIIRVENGCRRLPNGKLLHNDLEFGLLIQEG